MGRNFPFAVSKAQDFRTQSFEGPYGTLVYRVVEKYMILSQVIYAAIGPKGFTLFVFSQVRIKTRGSEIE